MVWRRGAAVAIMIPERYRTEALNLLRAIAYVVPGRIVPVLLRVVGVIAATWILMPLDPALDRALGLQFATGLDGPARFMSWQGNYLTLSVPLAVLMWTLGYAMRHSSWRMAAIACLLAATAAGLTANSVKALTGRPRPYTNERDGFRGPTLNHDLHSFASGHSANAFGVAAAVAGAFPAVRVPALAAASAIAWSRVHLARHHVSDVFLGGAVGVLFGLWFGVAARIASGRRGVGAPPRRPSMVNRGTDWLRGAAAGHFSRRHLKVEPPRPARGPPAAPPPGAPPAPAGPTPPAPH